MTLMELLLALALSSLVLYLVSMAIDLQWRLMDTNRGHVEETILARSVLRRIADDLRGAVLYSPPDLAGLDAIADNPLASAAGGDPTAIAGALGGAQLPMDTPLGTGASGQNNQAPPAEDPAAAEAAAQQQQASIVGLYGTQSWLAIDLSRLPRIDEYDALVAPGGNTTPLDIPSDVKTVTYFIADETMSGAAAGEEEFGPSAADAVAGNGNLPPIHRGLIRQQMSKAMASQNELAQASDTTTGAQILAEEVTGVEFAYFDGVDWYTDWNSRDNGGLPVAVAIAVQVEMKGSRVSARTAAVETGADETTHRETSIHRLIVQLPAARKFAAMYAESKAAADQAAAESEAAAQEAAQGAAQGSTQSSTPAGQGAGS